MRTKSSLIPLAIVAGSILSSRFVAAKHESGGWVGHGLEQHYKCEGEPPKHCSEGVKLTFGSANAPTSLAVDFVAREEPKGPSNPPATIEMLVELTTLNSNAPAAPGLVLQMDRRPYPLPARIDDRGALVAFVAFNDFVRLTNAPSITGRVFEREFTTSAQQMTVLRTVATRWGRRSLQR
jgi:hypothetical protein